MHDGVFVSDSLMGSASEDEEDDDNSTASSVLKHHPLHGSLPPAPGETNNNSLPHSDISSSIGQVKKLLHSVADALSHTGYGKILDN